jgi:hypothetical protein
MSSNKTILILGDSWACGELSLKEDGHSIVHKGLEQYLIDQGHTVINLGVLGGANSNSISNYLNFTQHADYVFFFQTEPTREGDTIFIELLKQFKSIRTVFDHLINECYININKIAKDKNQTVHLIGGYSVVTDNASKFSNLNNFISNVSSLIDPDTKFDFYGYFMQFEWFVNIVENAKKKLNFDDYTVGQLKKEYIDMVNENTRITLYMSANEDYYFPDGMHTNRNGHRIIFNQVKKLMNEK